MTCGYMLHKFVQSFSTNGRCNIPGIFTSGNELQKLGDDDMYPAVMADPLLGEESLFNDSLDDVHVHEKAIRAALTDVEKTADNEREHNLDDSLDYDMTQLPFDDVVGESGLNTNLISRGSSNQGDAVNSKSTSGFQVAVQIPMSSTCDDGGTSEVTDSKSSATDVSKAVKDTTDDHHQKTPQDQQQMEKSTHTSDTSTVKNSAPSDSRVSKSSKLVPSFGRRKNKTTLSPPTKVDTKKEAHVELDKQTSSVAGSCQTTEKEDTSGEETLQEGDQCVPETTARVENPSNTFAGNNIRKNKQNATSGERERNMSDNKELGQNTSSTSAISRKEKKLTAAREQKKQEKEEKRKEAERKKLEREKKKKEAEEKKAEKERLKKERQLELERKRAEREQKKIQQVLKKAESKDGKQSSKRTKKANKENGGSNDEIITESTPVSQSKSKGDISMSATQLDIEMEDADQSNGNKNINENMQSECGGVTQPQENASLPDTSKSLQPCSESLGMNGAGREGELKEQSTADLPLESAEMEEGCSMAREDLEEVEQGEGNGEPLDDARDPASTADLPLESAEMEEGCSMAREDLEEVEQGEGNGEPLDDARDPASHDKENDGKNKISAHNNEPQSKRIKIVFGPTSKNAQKKTESSRVNSLKENGDVSKTKTAVNVGITKSIPKAVSAAKPKKTPGSAAAKKKPASKGTISTTSNPKAAKLKQMKRTRPQGSKVEPESKRSKPANYTGPVWVQCERSSCKKWRQLRDCTDPLSLPESWNCTMNTGNEWSEP